MSQGSGSGRMAAVSAVCATLAVIVTVALVLAGTGVITFGGGASRSAPTYGGDSQDAHLTDREEGCPTDDTSLAGSRLTISDPSGEAIVDTAIDCNSLQQQLGDDQEYHVTPGILPGFWYLRDHYELPAPGSQGDRWVLVGHTGPPEANAPLTGMVGLPQLPSHAGYQATLVSPLGTEQLGVLSAENIGDSDITSYLQERKPLPGERVVAGCRVVNGTIIDQTVVVRLVPIESL